MTKHYTMNINQKEEFRYQYAGMALQAFITNNEFMSSVKRIADEVQMDFKEAAASVAVEFADALIAELDGKDKP